MMISGVLDRLESNLDVLAASEAKVGRWILGHPRDVLSLTVRGLAERSHSSQAAVIRLCRTLQIDGYSSLKVLLAADLVRHETYPMKQYAELNPEVGFDALMTAYVQGVKASLTQTINNVREEQIAEASRMLATARRIIVFGVAASRVVADDLHQKLVRLGYPVAHLSDFHVALMSCGLLEVRDVLILVSFSGRTEEVLELARLARGRGATVIAMTQFRTKNPLAEEANLVFYVTAIEPEPRIGATNSVMGSMAISGALALCLANGDPDEMVQHLSDTEDAVRHHKVVADLS